MAAVIASFSVTSFAKTEGSYLGLGLINTNLKINQGAGKIANSNQPSVGLSYKYAVNFNNVFVAPELFYDFNSNKNKVGGDGFAIRLNQSYGAKLNIGYDVTDKIAPYALIGYSMARLGVSDPENGPERLTQEALVYGLGVKYQVCNNMSANAGYEMNRFNKGDVRKFVSYNVARIGVAYNF